MLPRQPKPTLTDTLFPYTPLCRSAHPARPPQPAAVAQGPLFAHGAAGAVHAGRCRRPVRRHARRSLMRWYLDASLALHAVLPTADSRTRDWLDAVHVQGEEVFSSTLLELELIRNLRRERQIGRAHV